ncbi:MvdC/MvdD family ATP grasp protein [Streptomyces sp. NPDC056244]|uniref:MvdC/MvdD family ATP grasp protein n=1 Tax=Streptomyces sp. NPDC056244 TaxID=3345762 RepID=UPI0035DAFA96
MVDAVTDPGARRRRGPVCVLTTQGDRTADRVILRLHALGVPVIRVDAADFPHSARLDARMDSSAARWSGTLTAHGRTTSLDEVRAVFWWHPGKIRTTADGLTPRQAEWLGREATAGFVGVLASLDCLHLNHPLATHAAQSKADALAQAARCGLNIPSTWIGNDPDAAAAFVTGKETVAKSLSTPLFHPQDTTEVFFTHPVTAPLVDGSTTGTAYQFQRLIRKEFEVRLIVVGDRIFPARIDIKAGTPEAPVDYRAHYEDLTYRPVDVPCAVQEGVTALMAHYGLRYAALDLLVDGDGRWWLVDLNPAGQYGWIEHHLPALAISAEIADLLAGSTTAGPVRHGTSSTKQPY